MAEEAPPIRAVLVDVGGTLWPDQWPPSPADLSRRRDRLSAAFPGLRPDGAAVVLAALEQAGASLDGQEVQDTGAYVGRTLRQFGLADGPGKITAVIDAMCLPADVRASLFPGAAQLLGRIRNLRLSCVIVSNAVWRSTAGYWRDFTTLGIAAFLDEVVSSVDAGIRKPNPGMFSMAAAAAGVPAAACVVVGNSEARDIRPARSLGMRTLRVAIEEPRPLASAADYVAGSLFEAAAVLGAWCGNGGPSAREPGPEG